MIRGCHRLRSAHRLGLRLECPRIVVADHGFPCCVSLHWNERSRNTEVITAWSETNGRTLTEVSNLHSGRPQNLQQSSSIAELLGVQPRQPSCLYHQAVLHSLRESSRKHLTFSRDYSSRMNEEGDTLWIENSKAACGSLVLKRFSRAVGCCSHYACTVRPDGNTCRSDIISQTRLRSASD